MLPLQTYPSCSSSGSLHEPLDRNDGCTPTTRHCHEDDPEVHDQVACRHARSRTHRGTPIRCRFQALPPGAASDGADSSCRLEDSTLQAAPSTDRTGARRGGTRSVDWWTCRSEVEQRDKRREARRRVVVASVTGAVMVVLSIALVFALISRRQAVERGQIALARQATRSRMLARPSEAWSRAASGWANQWSPKREP